ncbi:MAG: M48 family metalloprotease, partial [Deltaproteobacteria bacterium]|nr:M48 family metalloprotease [Deltaproteobacteria bacterium]
MRRSVEEQKNNNNIGQDQKAKAYNRLKRRVSYVEIGLGLAFLLILLLTGWTFNLRDIAVRVASGPFWNVLIYFLFLTALFEIITLPLAVYSRFVIERRFGLLRQSGLAWVWDYIKGVLLSLILGGAAIEALYFFIRVTGKWWWLSTGMIFAFFFVLMAQLAPVLIMPIFYKFKPLADDDLSARLTALCERTGARVRGIYEWGLSSKTAAVNAALVGWGPTRRVILSDNLVKDFSAPEVEVILAHELGHHQLR